MSLLHNYSAKYPQDNDTSKKPSFEKKYI